MKKRTLFSLLLGLVLCLTVMTVAASAEDIIIPEIQIECDVTSVTAGVLPKFHASTTTEHATIEAYTNTANTCWVRSKTSKWFGFGDNAIIAENDGTTHYGLRLLVRIGDGYTLSESTKIILNGVERNDEWNEISLFPWGGYVTIDLGLASGENISTHTVTFYEFDDKKSTVTVLDGGKTQRPSDPERPDYFFDGWYADSTYTTVYDFEKTVHSDITVYAKWLDKTVLPSINIVCEISPPVVGELPKFQASTTTEHATIGAYAYNSNTCWVRNEGSQWHGFGDNAIIAEKDGTTHYGLRLLVEIGDGYKLDKSTKIILNGVERNDEWNEIRLFPWGAYVIIDLGLAADYGGAGWRIFEDDGILHLNGPVTNPSTMGVDQSPWQEYKSKIKSVVCDPGASIDSGVMLFALCPNLTKADLRGLDTSGVKDMYGMFGVNARLEEVDFTGLDTSAVESVESMFAFCQNLHVLDWKECDLSHVTNAADLFTYSGLVRVTAGSKTLSGIADAMIAHEPGWRDINSGAVYSTASGLKAIAGTVTLDSFVGLIIPGGTQRIEAEAFRGIDAATVVIPNGCQYIGSQAFAGCANLTKVYIPSSVQTILSDAFTRCPHITIYTPTGSRAAQWCGVTGVPCVEY